MKKQSKIVKSIGVLTVFVLLVLSVNMVIAEDSMKEVSDSNSGSSGSTDVKFYSDDINTWDSYELKSGDLNHYIDALIRRKDELNKIWAKAESGKSLVAWNRIITNPGTSNNRAALWNALNEENRKKILQDISALTDVAEKEKAYQDLWQDIATDSSESTEEKNNLIDNRQEALDIMFKEKKLSEFLTAVLKKEVGRNNIKFRLDKNVNLKSIKYEDTNTIVFKDESGEEFILSTNQLPVRATEIALVETQRYGNSMKMVLEKENKQVELWFQGNTNMVPLDSSGDDSEITMMTKDNHFIGTLHLDDEANGQFVAMKNGLNRLYGKGSLDGSGLSFSVTRLVDGVITTDLFSPHPTLAKVTINDKKVNYASFMISDAENGVYENVYGVYISKVEIGENKEIFAATIYGDIKGRTIVRSNKAEDKYKNDPNSVIAVYNSNTEKWAIITHKGMIKHLAFDVKGDRGKFDIYKDRGDKVRIKLRQITKSGHTFYSISQYTPRYGGRTNYHEPSSSSDASSTGVPNSRVNNNINDVIGHPKRISPAAERILGNKEGISGDTQTTPTDNLPIPEDDDVSVTNPVTSQERGPITGNSNIGTCQPGQPCYRGTNYNQGSYGNCGPSGCSSCGPNGCDTSGGRRGILSRFFRRFRRW